MSDTQPRFPVEFPTIQTNEVVCPPPYRVDWGRTMAIKTRLALHPEYSPPDEDAPYGRFGGRPIIGSGMTKIIGGVYLGMSEREAVVVEEYPSEPDNLALFYEEFMTAMNAYVAGGKRFKSEVLGAIFQLVKKRLEYVGDKDLDGLIKRVTNYGGPDQKIALHAFVTEGKGACTHQSLLVGYMLEKLRNESDPSKQLNGHFSIERNSVAIGEIPIGAHCWVRYTTATGTVLIIDVAQNRFDTLENLKRDPTAWFYDRPEAITVV